MPEADRAVGRRSGLERRKVSGRLLDRCEVKLTDALMSIPRPEGYQEPALIVGVEADVGNRHDWHDVSCRRKTCAGSIR